jgi:hypothetical protein
MNTLQFIFREKLCTGEISVTSPNDTFFFLIALKDRSLAAEFGKDVTIMTDFISLVGRKNDVDGMTELKQSIFAALKFHPSFVQAAAKRWVDQYAS